MEFFCISVVFIAVVVIGTAFSIEKKRLEALRESEQNRELSRRTLKTNYDAALAELRKKPNDPNVRETALQKGRAYSDFTRNAEGVTLYDEMAMKNDLDAAAAAATVQNPAPASSPIPLRLEDRLLKLKDLKTQGLITEDEYAMRRQAMIDEI